MQSTRKNIHGILLLDKPLEMTSNRALQKVKRLFHAKKAGHTGSLDPLATGMLPLCFGEATKFSQFLLDADKSYRVTAKLGIQTTTGDAEGRIVATHPVVGIDIETLKQASLAFLGEQDQIPPMFSAIKIQGKPLYELARQGIEIERKSRRITIFSLTVESFNQDEVTLEVHCSKGTYIRTLVEDLGKALGCGAHVIGLRRSSVSPYGQARMYTLEELQTIIEAQGEQALLSCLLPVETAVEVLPVIKLTTAAGFYLRTGQAIRTNLPPNASLVRLVSEDACFLGIGQVMTDGRVKPHRLLACHDIPAMAV